MADSKRPPLQTGDRVAVHNRFTGATYTAEVEKAGKSRIDVTRSPGPTGYDARTRRSFNDRWDLYSIAEWDARQSATAGGAGARQLLAALGVIVEWRADVPEWTVEQLVQLVDAVARIRSELTEAHRG